MTNYLNILPKKGEVRLKKLKFLIIFLFKIFKLILMLINIIIWELQNCINNINLLIVPITPLPPKPHVFVNTVKECGFFSCRWFENFIKNIKEFFFSNKEFFSIKNYFIVNKLFLYKDINNYTFNIIFFCFMILIFLYKIYSLNVIYYIYLAIFISYYYSYKDISKIKILDKIWYLFNLNILFIIISTLIWIVLWDGSDSYKFIYILDKIKLLWMAWIVFKILYTIYKMDKNIFNVFNLLLNLALFSLVGDTLGFIIKIFFF